ncbi:16S rRNA (uracil1498-N3)-methyltransferase [Cognatiyoonia koreensis]|uniref:Ribosomal RNA small subunit methyltransferase E n=1 Tax=Cognatiyoonia koreensis TaxID=364200 RepID=A0A1I0RDQ1_9RHOB|nr:16S rRNA (uracil(1498)-N(3))-methyltransferase [Cognatiyoonia koreensis]SEW38970.1 16S rRNA (uracil1498-N3)-methyltransferase [Cognatiyoonia koreensis]
MASKVRLYVDHPLSEGQTVPVSRDQANYLFAVMRLQVGTVLSLINGHDGEWDAEVVAGNKRSGALRCLTQTRPLRMPPDLWLLFAPLKKTRTDFIVEKAAEMGAARIVPVQTDFTNADRIRQDKLQAHVIEATEQCGGTFVPEVAHLQKLSQVLADWDPSRRLLFCDETLLDETTLLAAENNGPWAILIGPEGGFSENERDMLRKSDFAVPISLGPRILRADTAAVAAMTVWQQALGDWS